MTRHPRSIPLDIEDQLLAAERIARGAHQSQVDHANAPYIEHVEAVADALNTTTQKIIAWLHDVIEDTDVTYMDLRDEGIGLDIIDKIHLLTRTGGDARFYYLKIAGDADALAVKVADMRNNVSRLEALNEIDPETAERLASKYGKALPLLTDPKALMRLKDDLMAEVRGSYESARDQEIERHEYALDNLVAMRDQRHHEIAQLVTEAIETIGELQ